MTRSLFWLAIATMVAPPPVLASFTKKAVAMKIDFAHVTDRAAAEALVRQGELVKVLLFPAEFGGEDIPENTSFITPDAADARSVMIGTLRRFIREGLIDHMTVDPVYAGNSFVPKRITMRASEHGGTGTFEPAIEVW